MTVTQEQYNTVVNGLRVQLELQRSCCREKQEIIKELRELRNLDRLRMSELNEKVIALANVVESIEGTISGLKTKKVDVSIIINLISKYAPKPNISPKQPHGC